MRRTIGIGLMLPAVLMSASGCVATRDWVRETVGRRTNEIDQRVTAVDEQRKQDAVQHRQYVEGVESRLNTKVDGVEQLAKGAGARADEVDARLTRLWQKRNVRDLADSVTVQFAFNRWDLDDKAQTTLVTLVKELQQNPKLVVDLEGYADPQGPREYNVQLSQRRVEAVRRYLVQQGIELPRIQSIGLGVLDDPKLPNAAKRRVTVKLMVLAE